MYLETVRHNEKPALLFAPCPALSFHLATRTPNPFSLHSNHLSSIPALGLMAALQGRPSFGLSAAIGLPMSCQNPGVAVRASMVPSLGDNDCYRNERIEGYKRIVLIPMIEQMMFVAGETGEPSSETTTLIEQIVHEQVYEMVGYLFDLATTTTNLNS